ncbi:MAG: hypothetical protein P8R42_11900 [Candidatus Binatia bacterium]|nr:hypothetical protein [Candidatus Binatia bacterium]
MRAPLAHDPGSVFHYSSGTSNLVARLAQEAAGGSGDAGLEAFMQSLIDCFRASGR